MSSDPLTSATFTTDGLVLENNQTTHSPLPSDAQKYGYGTLAVLIISICPLISVAIAGFQKSHIYKFVISAMLGLCVGSLVGDSLLHLLPEILGAHSHAEDEEHAHEDEEHGHDISYLWKMIVACASVWSFLVLQMVIQGVGELIENKREKKECDVSIHNGVAFSNNAVTVESVGKITDLAISQQIDGPTVENGDRSFGIGEMDDESLHVHAHSSVAWMVTIGDGLHNFTDGLAIGAAFSKSMTSGLAISIAVLCHELPHEFGDAALMLSAGWSYKLVLVLQCLAQATAFIGLYIGIALSNAFEDAQTWIFSIAAGMFLYVALCDAVPEIMELFRHHKSVLIAVLANVGIAVGYLIMILLGVYEEKIVIK